MYFSGFRLKTVLSLDKGSLEGMKSITKRCNICFRIQVHWKGKGSKGTQGVDIGRGRGEQIQEEAIFWDFLAFVALSGETVEGQFTSCHHCQHLDLTPTLTGVHCVHKAVVREVSETPIWHSSV